MPGQASGTRQEVQELARRYSVEGARKEEAISLPSGNGKQETGVRVTVWDLRRSTCTDYQGVLGEARVAKDDDASYAAWQDGMRLRLFRVKLLSGYIK